MKRRGRADVPGGLVAQVDPPPQEGRRDHPAGQREAGARRDVGGPGRDQQALEGAQ